MTSNTQQQCFWLKAYAMDAMDFFFMCTVLFTR